MAMTTSESTRTSLPLSAGTTTSSATPTSGRKRTQLRTAASTIARAPDQRASDSREHQPGVEMEASGLDAREHAATRAAERRHAVERAVEDGAVAEAQEDPVRDPDQRPADQPLVELVDEVLRREDAMHAGEV